MGKLSELMKTKVAGIPAIYLVGAFVAILALVAWKMQQTPPEANVPTDPGSTEQDGADIPTADIGGNYDAITGKGTVTTVPQVVESVTPEPDVSTNESWAKGAIEWLVSQNKATAGDAQNAIGKYVAGSQLSYAEGQLRDVAVREKGLPPDSVTQVGHTDDPPARRAFAGASGGHTVLGSNDNTATKLANLYYGASTSSTVGMITKANPKLGAGPYAKGAKLWIPALHPARFFTATRTVRTKASIASKNGITTARLEAYNPGMANVVPVGTKVRVG